MTESGSPLLHPAVAPSRHRQRRFEAAHEGALFLDEIGDIPLSIQVKLLRVLGSKRFERVGDHRPISVDVRIVTATKKNLTELIATKKFREDLFFSINVIPIYLPPLREHLEDTLIEALRQSKGNQSQVARILGINRVTV